MSAVGRADARAALAGNPSDGYGGATLAVTVGDYRAEVELERSSTTTIDPPSTLVGAALDRFSREIDGRAHGVAARWRTSIPREVGLGGSSAIVIATARALCALNEVELSPDRLASLALAVEVEDLGIAAGPQDRFAQAHTGLTFMDFGPRPGVESLDPSLLPPLVVAHALDAGDHSGAVHEPLRQRFARGEREMVAAMEFLAEQARGARDALVDGDLARFAQCVDATFDTRRRLVPLDPRHVGLIETARRHGAAANYTGSGGAVVAVCRDEGHRAEVAEALARARCATSAV